MYFRKYASQADDRDSGIAPDYCFLILIFSRSSQSPIKQNPTLSCWAVKCVKTISDSEIDCVHNSISVNNKWTYGCYFEVNQTLAAHPMQMFGDSLTYRG